MRKLFTHRRARIALAFVGTLGVAAVALAIWTGILQMPFTGSTGDAPAGLAVSYGSQAQHISADNLLPREGVPVMGSGDWAYNFGATSTNNVNFSQSGTEPVNAVMKLAFTTPPTADVLANVHYRLGWETAGPGLPSTSAWAPAGMNSYTAGGTLAQLSTTGYTFPLPFQPATSANLRIVFWLDPAAPVSVAGQTFDGTLDVVTAAL
jgi:hypothetical protein